MLLLEARGVVMEFPGVKALDGVDFAVKAGEVHALMGENGAGKSTLIKVLSGLYQPTRGEIWVSGRRVEPRSPREAEGFGVSTVYQEVDLIPTMTVAENVCLGRQPRRFGLIDRKGVKRRAEQALERLECRIDVGRLLGEYPIGIQQMAAIARALDVQAKVLILDEPTSSLDNAEVEELFRILNRLRAEGMGIVFVTHFIEHVYRMADRITVLRNGTKVGTWPAAELPREAMIEAMTGRKITELRAAEAKSHQHLAGAETVLDAQNLGKKRTLEPTSVRVPKGSALGLGGLLGSGRTELARLLFGADAPDSGGVHINGQKLRPGSVRDAISHGMALCPEDRKAHGLVLDLSVRENIVLALQARRGAAKPVPRREQDRLARHYIESLRIRTPGPETPVGNLSGGNQQKVLLAKWLAIQPKVLILDEPTRGIDVGAKAEIETLIASLREAGLAVVFVSAELDELLRVCDRVQVMRDRRPGPLLEGEDVTEGRLLQAIAGGGSTGNGA